MSGDAIDPQSLNKYNYTRNDPINLVDPTGLYFGDVGIEVPCRWDNGILVWWDFFQIPWEICVGFTVSIIVISRPRTPPPPRLFAGFSNGDIERINKASSRAIDILNGVGIERGAIDGSCRGNLQARAFNNGKHINVNDLIIKLIFLKVKSRADDESQWGSFDIINGADSEDPEIKAERRKLTRAGGYIDLHGRGIVLFSAFFDGGAGKRIGFDESRGIALIHEAIHLQGISDLDFGSGSTTGSQNLNTFIIKSCFNKFLTHDDLSFVIN